MPSTDSYRSMAKGTAMMGGVQVFNILINIVRGKLIAMFLGPYGMGISSLLSSSTATVQQVSSLGLNLAIVRQVAGTKDDIQQLNKSVSVIRILLKLTALIGAVAMLVLSGRLSQWTFGNTDYRWHYLALSLMVAFAIVSQGEASILQGLHALKRLAYSTLVGSITGLVVGVPLYYFFGVNGIAPAMIALSAVTMSYYIYSNRKELGTIKISFKWNSDLALAKTLISLGLISMISSLLGTFTNYGINAFIRYFGSTEDVGLFQAASSMTNQYVGLVFAAMSMDYFPRLAAVANDNNLIRGIVNKQSEIVLLVIAPIVMLVIIMTPILIRVLLTNEFLVLCNVIRCMAIGVFFKAACYPMGYISFSKGDKKTFFLLEGVFGNLLLFGCNTFAYSKWGLEGLGISMVVFYIFSWIVYIVVTKILYDFRPDMSVLIATFGFAVLIGAGYASSIVDTKWLSIVLMVILFVVTAVISMVELDKRLDIKAFLKCRIRSKKQ